MKTFISSFAIATVTIFLMISAAFAEVEVQTVEITSDNQITGDITATNGGTVTVGDTTITNTTAQEINSSSKNAASSITADNGQVDIGSVTINNVQGGSIKVHTGTKAGNVKATNGGSVKLGHVEVDNTSADIDINQQKKGSFNNNLQDVIADGQGSKANVGNVTVKDVDGKVKIETGNSAQGDLKATNGGEIHMGNVTLTGKGKVDVDVTTINRANGGITAEDHGKVNMGTVYMNNIDGGKTAIEVDNTADGLLHAAGAGSEINLGRVDVTNAKDAEIDVHSTNQVGAIDATQYGVVNVGRASIDNIKGGKVSITTENTATGKLEAKNGGKIDLGTANVAHAEDADITINATNNVGSITADDSVVRVGSADLENVRGGTVKVTTNNTVGGTITAKGGGHVSIGHTSMQ